MQKKKSVENSKEELALLYQQYEQALARHDNVALNKIDSIIQELWGTVKTYSTYDELLSLQNDLDRQFYKLRVK